MSTLLEHAKNELKASGFDRPDSDYGGDVYNDVLSLISLFSNQGHSGGSAGLVVSLFSKLARYEPLGPLTGRDDEWVEVGEGVFQNTRCSRVFRTNGVVEDIDGIIWREPDGSTYTNHHSRTLVTFPYVPTSVYKSSQDDPGRSSGGVR